MKNNIIISVPIESVGVDTIEDNPLLESIVIEDGVYKKKSGSFRYLMNYVVIQSRLLCISFTRSSSIE